MKKAPRFLIETKSAEYARKHGFAKVGRRIIDGRGGVSVAVTNEDYDDLLKAQSGKCAICRRAPDVSKKLSIDHCHLTGTIRGLLCSRCNTAIGLVEDNIKTLESAAAYLTRHAKYQDEEVRESYKNIIKPV